MVKPTWTTRPSKNYHYWSKGFDYFALYQELENMVEETFKFKLQSELECE